MMVNVARTEVRFTKMTAVVKKLAVCLFIKLHP